MGLRYAINGRSFELELRRCVWRHVQRWGFAAGVVGLMSACSWFRPQPVPGPEPVQYSYAPLPYEPRASSRASGRKTAHDQITILPKEDGSIGGVVVRHEGVAVLLDKAYATALVEGFGRVTQSTYEPEAAIREFATILSALPDRPVQFRLYFLEDSDEMTPESEEEIGKIFAELSTRPAPEIVVIGHTDAVGAGQYNDKLSLRRAEAVRDELVRLGMPDDSIRVEGRGKREPLVTTADGVAEPMNRRVEIDVR
jgi:outer membrane protein OmpA-like peptidoglycan-associated protein